jgi:HK97 family phage portal protein
MLHVRYQGSVSDTRGHGPLEAVAGPVVAAETLNRYATTIASSGLVPSSILEAPEEMSADQAGLLRDQWVQQRMLNPGYPAVLSGGLKWTPTQLDPEKMTLMDMQKFNESRIAVALGVPPFLVGLPSGGDSMTYSNVSQTFDFHWRMGLRPKAQFVMSALSEWLLPRQTRVELNRDEYVQPGPLERAQTAQILHGIVDPVTQQPALTVQEIRDTERLDNSTPDLAAGVLK